MPIYEGPADGNWMQAPPMENQGYLVNDYGAGEWNSYSTSDMGTGKQIAWQEPDQSERKKGMSYGVQPMMPQNWTWTGGRQQQLHENPARTDLQKIADLLEHTIGSRKSEIPQCKTPEDRGE